ncbi:hypothetical protein JCM8097_003822 [Rhodosporidiobolus ruineniae]
MAKAKSSASSATRKKHAAKAAKKHQGDNDDGDELPQQQQQQGKGGQQAKNKPQRGEKRSKKDKKQPKVKQFIPPPAPPKGQPDPVDLFLLGQGKHPDPDLVVVLRRLTKKDEATVQKGVDGLEAWVNETLRRAEVNEGEDWEREMREEGVVDAMACWAHHFPRLSLHPSRRLRLQVHALHSTLTAASFRSPTAAPPLLQQTRSALLAPLWVENPQYVGAWCVASWDTDRSVRREAKRSWDAVLVSPQAAPAVEEDEQRLEPEGIVLAEHADPIANFALAIVLGSGASPSSGTDTPGGASSSAGADAVEDPAFLRTSAVLALSYLLETLPAPLALEEDVVDALTGAEMWSLVERSEGDPRRGGLKGAREQPPMVRRAIYEMLGALVRRTEEILVLEKKDKAAAGEGEADEGDEDDEDEPEARLTTIASKVLANCWAEEEGWPGIIAFLRRYPQAWSLVDSVLAPPTDSPAEEKEEDVAASSAFTPSATLTLFLTHLSLGCSSHPTSLYPTILLLLSTLPTSVLPPTPEALSLLFEHFWAAHASRALSVGGRLAVDAWAAAFLECLVFELARLDSTEAQEALAKEWLAGRMWSVFLGLGEEKPVGNRKIAGGVEKVLVRVQSKAGEAVFATVWAEMQREALGVFAALPGASTSLTPLALALQAFAASKDEGLQTRAAELAAQSVQAAVGRVQQAEEAKEKDDLLHFVAEVKDLVKGDEAVSQLLDELALSALSSLLPSSITALSLLISHLESTSSNSRDKIWSSLLTTPPAPAVLLSLLDALPASLVSSLPSADLDAHLLALATGRVFATDGAHSSPAELSLLQRLVLSPAPLASPALQKQLLQLAASALQQPVRAALRRRWSAPPELDALVAPALLLAEASKEPSLAKQLVDLAGSPIALFDIAYLLPEIRLEQRGVYVPSDAVAAAKEAWVRVVMEGGETTARKVLETLRVRVADPAQRASPVELVEAASALVDSAPQAGVSLAKVLPPAEQLQQLYSELDLAAPPSALSILDPLVPLSSSDSLPVEPEADDASLTSYSRSLVALLDLAARDHALLRRPSSSWVLPHLLLLAQTASDELLAPSPASRAGGGGVFGPSTPLEVLERVAAAAEGASNYLLSSLSNTLESGWHAAAVQQLRGALKADSAPANEGWEKDPLLATLDALFRSSRTGAEGKKVQATRAVRTVLSAVLRYSDEGEGVQDAERWLALALNMPQAPELASAILLAIKPVLLETPRFTRYQNELAASLAGVRPEQLDIKALPLLAQLLASAPPLDAPIIFLPQQRTVFLVQAIQRWISSDEPLPEGLETGVVELFGQLAPIIQDLSGSHWELMFDLIESSLEGADWEEPSTLPAVFHAARLLTLIKELAGSNAELRDTAKLRIDASLELVLGLFVSRPASLARDRPRALVVETMARLVKDLPPKLLSMDKSFSQLLRLLQDPSLAVQLSSYDLLRRIIAQHVSDLVVEVELDAEEKVKIEYPAALLKVLEEPLRDGDSAERATSYLFAWMTTFAFFESASPRLRSAYIEQLRNVELVTSSLLPSLFGLLNLSDRTRAVDLSPWFIDDFHFEYFDASSPLTLPIFAAHVYYRALQAVPSIIRTYWTSLQNLALSRSVQSFTSRNFSPLLIDDELAVLRDPASPVGKQLRDNDDFTVKVASNGSEVKVVFVVDEESMELGIKVPNEFPLAGVEVKDVRKVGVTDKQWRAWLLGMQQVITSQSAAIADAILLFKRNVTLHFEGVESCAICYSTVSTVDRSLPSKNCRVCSQPFHAQCLYKWFQTSSSSTCPLCRSVW